MRRLFAVTLPCLFLMLVGCGTTPNPRFYALTGAAPPASSSSELSVAVGPVTIPASVDRPQIVVTVSPNRVRLDEFDRWAAPLQNDIARAVAANLVAALGTPRVMLASAPVTAERGLPRDHRDPAIRVGPGRGRHAGGRVGGQPHQGRQVPDRPHDGA